MTAGRAPVGRRRAGTVARLALALLVVAAALPLAAGGAVLAQQAPAPRQGIEEALERARSALETALDAPGPRHPDASAWRRALDAAEAAARAAADGPRRAEALALLARTYQEVRWWSRALVEWERLAQLQGGLSPEERQAWRDAAMQVVFARYAAGDVAGAAARVDAILAALPDDVEALRWSARLALEAGRLEEALADWTRLLELRPDDEGARFYRDLARERLEHGREASDAFRRGLERYEAGDLAGAADAFAASRQAAPGWDEPLRWRARTLMELGRSDAAVAAWEQLVASDPGDADAAWFLERARLEARVGRTAALAADEARAAREAGERQAAVAAWRRAVQAAPGWLEARMGLARTALELGEAATAEAAYRAVLELAPSGHEARAEARAGLERVAMQERLGAEAGIAYAEALAAYERSDMATAEERFRRVVEAVPRFAEGWGWLGRLAFARGDWAAAAEAYQRASELAPGDDDYAFFAQEARDLAGLEPPGGPGADPDPDPPEDEP